MWIPWLLLLAGCGPAPSDPTLYTRALSAADGAAGWALCAELADDQDRGDCETAVAARFGYFARCDEVAAGRWRDECWFEAAEAQARAGDPVQALTSCGRGGFAKQCQDHILGMMAMGWIDEPLGEVVTKLAPIRSKLDDRSLPFLFWRHWFRNRIARGVAFGISACGDGACTGAASAEMEAALRQQPDPCAAVPVFSWDQDPDTHQRVLEARLKVCTPQPPGQGVWKAPAHGRR